MVELIGERFLDELPADVPHVSNNGPIFYQAFDNRSHDDKTIICTDHHIPQVEKLHSLIQSQAPIIVSGQKLGSLMFQQLGSEKSPQT